MKVILLILLITAIAAWAHDHKILIQKVANLRSQLENSEKMAWDNYVPVRTADQFREAISSGRSVYLPAGVSINLNDEPLFLTGSKTTYPEWFGKK